MDGSLNIDISSLQLMKRSLAMSYMMKVLTDLGVDFTKQEHTHYKFQSKGFMDLIVETWKMDEWLHVSMAHYHVQEGDLMSDPMIEFRAINFTDLNGMVQRETQPIDCSQNGLCKYKETTTFGQDLQILINAKLRLQIGSFLVMWARKIKNHGISCFSSQKADLLFNHQNRKHCMTIKMSREKMKAIEQFIGTDSTAVTSQKYDTLRWKFRGNDLKDLTVDLNGKRYPCDTVFKIRTDLLDYNFQNRRISIYVSERERQKKETPKDFKSNTVSVENEEDHEWMQRLLLGKESLYGVKSNTPMFTEELITQGQIEPAVITLDGTLRNGNRRKAIFHDILDKINKGVTEKGRHYSTFDPNRFKYMKVIILPKDVTEEELFDLENFLQTKQEWKLQYDSISVLNIIKDAIDKYGLTPKLIKEKYLHNMTEKQIQDDYDKIKLIDEYLDYEDAHGQYGLVVSQQEIFEDAAKRDFMRTGLAGLQREDTSVKNSVIRARRQLLYDIVTCNRCDNKCLRPSDKTVRSIVTDIFRRKTKNPKQVIEKFYSGVDVNKLRDCDATNVQKFAGNVDIHVFRSRQLVLDAEPLEKLKEIFKRIQNVSASDLKNLARKKEAHKILKVIKDGIDRIEREIAKHANQDE